MSRSGSSFALQLAAFALAPVLFIPALASAHSVTTDGSASEWIGVPGVPVHSIVSSSGEWIYKGEAGDVRTDPADPAEPNYDITEVRITTDATNLYLLVRFADITNFDEPSICFGIDNDMSGGDGSLNFNGDESGLTYGGVGAKMPEFIVQVHNAQVVSPITQVEIYDDNDGNGTVWYAPPTWSAFMSATNNLLEVAVPLTSLGLTPTSTFGFSLVSYDNGNTAGTGIAFNNVDDTTIDYPGNDALDVLGGTPGVSANAFARDLSDNDIDFQAVVTLPISSAVSDWTMFKE